MAKSTLRYWYDRAEKLEKEALVAIPTPHLRFVTRILPVGSKQVLQQMWVIEAPGKEPAVEWRDVPECEE